VKTPSKNFNSEKWEVEKSIKPGGGNPIGLFLSVLEESQRGKMLK